MRIVAKTRVGKFEGVDAGRAMVFKGIPYARPPVGKLRFRSPEPPPPIRSTYDATKFRPSCLQPPSELFPQTGPTEMSEDCLYLNIWTPRLDTKPRPVMVWIHGGAFVAGSGAFPWYDGARLANHEVVVVTLNYRLGPFGFLYLEALLGSTFAECSNLGLQDQMAALAWVRQHIEGFGGDPENITIFGESAGAMSAATLMGVPTAKGLFERVIAQSGAAHNVLPAEVAARIAEKFAEQLENITGERIIQGDAIQKIPATAVLDAGMETLAYFSDPRENHRSQRHEKGDPTILLPFQPVLDGSLIPRRPLDEIGEGNAAGIPLITGTTRDEYMLFTFTDRAFHSLDRKMVIRRIERTFITAKQLGLYSDKSHLSSTRQATDIYDFYVDWLRRHKRPADAKHVWAAVATDIMFRVPAIRLAEAQAPYAPSRLYLFTRPSPMANGKFGSPHAIDIPFVFGNLEDPAAKLFCGEGPEVVKLSSEMQLLWTSFAAKEPPHSPRVPEWPTYSLDRESRRPGLIVELGDFVGVVKDPEADKAYLWEGIL